nr:hypothetical protein Iba_chr10dCG12530 [Ipomoea batatas]
MSPTQVPGSSSLRRDGDEQVGTAVGGGSSDERPSPSSSFPANSTAVEAAVDVLPPLASTAAMACVDWQQRSMSSSGGGNIRSTSSKDLSGGGCWWFVKRRMEFAKDLELQSMQLFMDTQYGSIAHINLKLPPRDQDPPGYAFVEVI